MEGERTRQRWADLRPRSLAADPGTWVALGLLVLNVVLVVRSVPRAAAFAQGGDFGIVVRARGYVQNADARWRDVREWDEVVAIDGVRLPHAGYAQRAIELHRPGELRLGFRRDEREWEVSARGEPRRGGAFVFVRVATGALLALFGALAYLLRPREAVGWVFLLFCEALALLLLFIDAHDEARTSFAVQRAALAACGAFGLHLFGLFPRRVPWLVDRHLRLALLYGPISAVVLAFLVVYPDPPASTWGNLLSMTIQWYVLGTAVVGSVIVLWGLRCARREAAAATATAWVAAFDAGASDGAAARLRTELARSRAVTLGFVLGILVPVMWDFLRSILDLDVRFLGDTSRFNALPVLAFVGMTGYAIVRHNALAVDRFTAAVVGYAATLALLGGALGLLLLGLPALLGEVASVAVLQTPAGRAVATAACVLALRPVYRVVRGRVDGWFNRVEVAQARYVQALRALGEAASRHDAEATVREALAALSLLQVEHVGVWALEPGGGTFTRTALGVGAKGAPADERREGAAFPADASFVAELRGGGAAGVEGLSPRCLSRGAQERLVALELALVTPLVAFGEVRGLVGLGRKLSGGAFSASEVAYVEAVGTQLSFAMVAAAAAPAQVAGYRIERPLGTGGMAEVFLAWKVGVGGWSRRVALKRLRGDLVEEPGLVELFLDEARVAAQLSHPHVVAVYEVGERGGQHFIAMEYLEGPTLRQLLGAAKASGRFVPVEVALGIADEALQALEYVHGARDGAGAPLRLVHRDVTPSNLQLDAGGAVKLLDFGVARAASQVHVTQAGVVKGTLPYMAPEQAAGQAIDGRADLSSLAACLFELLSGEKPFPDGPRGEPPPPLAGLRSDVPPGLAAVIERGLAPDAAARFPSAASFREALLAAAEPLAPATPAERLHCWLGLEAEDEARATDAAATAATA